MSGTKAMRTFDAPRKPAKPTPQQLAAELRKQREKFKAARRTEIMYSRQLRYVAWNVGKIVNGFAPQGRLEQKDLPGLMETLREYSKALLPWARAVASRMFAEVSRRDFGAWHAQGMEISAGLREELRKPPLVQMQHDLLQEQIALITSLPTEAAERVHKLTMEAYVTGARPKEIAAEIMRSGEVTQSRANLIARTEVGRVAAATNSARSQMLGSTHFKWRTARDADVRELHKHLEGTVHPWNDPPVTGENGERSLPGAIYNCFTGDTLFGPIERSTRIFRGFYRGPLITLVVGNSFFEATPNHPIFTPRGWVAAGALNVGDDLLAVAPEGGDVTKQYVKNRYATFSEVFKAGASNMEAKQGSVFNFYGDAVTGNVNIVSTEQYLSLHNEARVFKRARYGMIAGAQSGIISAVIKRCCTQIFQALIPCFLNVLFFLRRTALRCEQFIAGGYASNFATHTLDVSLNSLGGSFKTNSKSACADPSRVKFSNESTRQVHAAVRLPLLKFRRTVIAKSVRHFEGYVFTAETDQGNYSITTAGVISKNCRCWAEPILPDLS